MRMQSYEQITTHVRLHRFALTGYLCAHARRCRRVLAQNLQLILLRLKCFGSCQFPEHSPVPISACIRAGIAALLVFDCTAMRTLGHRFSNACSNSGNADNRCFRAGVSPSATSACISALLLSDSTTTRRWPCPTDSTVPDIFSS